MDKRGEEVLRFSVQTFLSHSTERLRRGSLLCSRKILRSKTVRDTRGGEYHNFPSKLLCFTVPKNFVRESFSVPLISNIEKIWIRGGEEVLRFSVQNFLSHSTERLRRGSLLCSKKILRSKTVRDTRGGEYHNFPSKLFCFTVPKNFVREPFSVPLISNIEKIWIRGGEEVSRFSVDIFLSHSTENFRRGTLLCSRKLLVSKSLGTKEGANITISH